MMQWEQMKPMNRSEAARRTYGYQRSVFRMNWSSCLWAKIFLFFQCVGWGKSLHPNFPPQNEKLSALRQVLFFKMAIDTEKRGLLIGFCEEV